MNNRLSPDEMAKELEEARNKINDLEASIKLFDAKFESFSEAWNSSNAIAVKNKIIGETLQSCTFPNCWDSVPFIVEVISVTSVNGP